MKTRESLNRFAKLLATEDITVIHDSEAKTASFDTEKRILRVPVWENLTEYAYNLFMEHEVGHAIYTPNDGWTKTIKGNRKIHSALNIVEDARIERKMKRRFPGSKKDFYHGYKWLLQNDFFFKFESDKVTLKFNLLDRINLHYKIGPHYDIPFRDAERTFLDRIDMAEDWDEVVAIANDLLEYSAKNDTTESMVLSDIEAGMGDSEPGEPSESEEESKSSGGSSSEDEDGEEDTDENVGGSSDDGEEDTDENVGGSSDDGEEDTDENGGGSSDGSEDDDGEESPGGSSSEDEDDDGSEASTLDAESDFLQGKLTKSNVTSLEIDLDNIDIDRKILGYKKVLDHLPSYTEEATSFIKSEKKYVMHLLREFDRKKKASLYRKTTTAKTGVLDVDKMFSYKYNDDIFLRKDIVPEGKNHGLVIFVDWSVSMESRMKSTLRKLVLMIEFCRRAGIKHRVFAFTDNAKINNILNNNTSWNSPDDPFCICDVNFLELFNDSMSKHEYLRMVSSLINKKILKVFSLNFTPLNAAILCANTLVYNFKKNSNVEVVNVVCLTDGGSNIVNFSPKSSQDELVIVDKKTKKVFVTNNIQDGYRVTRYLVDILKTRHKVTVVNFYVTKDTSNICAIADYFAVHDINKLNSDYQKYKLSVGSASNGYDKIYLISDSVISGNNNNYVFSLDGTNAKAYSNMLSNFTDCISVNA